MKRIIIALLLLSPVTVFSQNLIGKNKKKVKKYLQQQIAKNDSLTITLTDNDSVLVYSIKAGKVSPADFVYGFTKTGKCRLEKVTAGCDSCYKKFLHTVLAQEKYGWRKINENQYVSKYTARMMIELPAESKEFSYTLLRTKWSKQLYNQLKGE